MDTLQSPDQDAIAPALHQKPADAIRPNEADLVESTREFIAGYKLPKKVIFVEEVQRAPNGKANYKWAKNVAVENHK